VPPEKPLEYIVGWGEGHYTPVIGSQGLLQEAMEEAACPSPKPKVSLRLKIKYSIKTLH
jgi:hypothetical protein